MKRCVPAAVLFVSCCPPLLATTPNSPRKQSSAKPVATKSTAQKTRSTQLSSVKTTVKKSSATTSIKASDAPKVAPPTKVKSTPAPSTVVLPQFKFKGKVAYFRGSSYGYISPREGETFELDLSMLLSVNKLSFGDSVDGFSRSYVPIPGPFQEVDVTWNRDEVGGTWNSLRAVASEPKFGHKVTLDLARKWVNNDPDYVMGWILIESMKRTIGVIEVQGQALPLSASAPEAAAQ